jgi:hypothetical protein
MDHGPGEQTAEALIHAEIFKILAREFPVKSIRSEFPIGHFFASKRGYAADIAVFHPLDEMQFGPEAKRYPIAVFELKRQGTRTELLNDLYRLAVVNRHTEAIGYFVLTAPLSKLIEMIRSIGILDSLTNARVAPIKIPFSLLKGRADIYSIKDHKPEKNFFCKLLDGTDELTKRLATSVAPPAGKTSEEPYAFVIFGIAGIERALRETVHHRITLRLTEVLKPASSRRRE